MSTHTCPHGGGKTTIYPLGPQGGGLIPMSWRVVDIACGDDGWLCPACREDRADARTDQLIEGLALAALIASKTGRDEQAKDEGVSGVEFLIRASREFAAALRGREGGEG